MRSTQNTFLLIVFAGLLTGCSPAGTPVDAVPTAGLSPEFPDPAVLQEMHDLLSERTRVELKNRYFDQSSEDAQKESTELMSVKDRLQEISDRLDEIARKELDPLERVAERAGLECHEESLYGQPSYGIILYAVATRNIRAGELLLFHAEGVYRTTGTFQPLTHTGQGFYFRPNAAVPEGERFVVACFQNAPEEIENVKNGFMPDSDRARDPRRAYQTQIFGSNDQPIAPPTRP